MSDEGDAGGWPSRKVVEQAQKRERFHERLKTLDAELTEQGLDRVEAKLEAALYDDDDTPYVYRWAIEKRLPIERARREAEEAKATRSLELAQRATQAAERAAIASERSANFTRAAAWASAIAAIAAVVAVLWAK